MKKLNAKTVKLTNHLPKIVRSYFLPPYFFGAYLYFTKNQKLSMFFSAIHDGLLDTFFAFVTITALFIKQHTFKELPERA